MKRIIRVFPRLTKATPDDELARVGWPTLFDEADEIEISMTFTWDQPLVHELAKEWKVVAPVTVGGPAAGTRGGDFTPGQYLKKGYVITSRGCPNKCSFCQVWRQDGKLRELPITDGWKIQDDNLLACSESHIRGVFKMLKRQPEKAIFTGGFESARLKPWHVDLLEDLKPGRIYFSYDRRSEYDPLREAVKLCRAASLHRGHGISCYVLVGYKEDTFEKADKRLRRVCGLGIMPFAMFYRDKFGGCKDGWKSFQREWANPVIVGAKLGKTAW